MSYINNTTTVAHSVPVRCCPFCGSEAQLLCVNDRYGIHCVCGACFPPAHGTEAEALMRWNRRSGGVSAAGGRSTKGVSTAKKARASRQNLRQAREVKRLLRISAKNEASTLLLMEARQVELVQAEARAAEGRARLKEREPQILADPALARLYELLDRPRAVIAVGQVVQDD